jgi:hypothetical protein
MKILQIFALLFLFGFSCAYGQNSNTILIKGIVKDKKTKEPLIGVSVYLDNKTKGTSTNGDGLFSLKLTLPAKIIFSYLGYETQSEVIKVESNLLEIYLVENIQQLKTATVIASHNEISKDKQNGVISINPREMRFIPSAAGERDPMQALTLMPGIRKNANGGEGFFVRGGSPDQNLIMIDDAPIYNPNHLLGFFSIFNPDAVSEVKLLKGAMPANTGGRLSSSINISMKEGNNKQWAGDVGVGLLSTRIFLNGPVFSPNLTLAIGARKSYVDQAFKIAGNNLPYGFLDLNAKVAFQISDRTKITYTQFNANDRLDYIPKNNAQDLDFGTTLNNSVYSLRFTHNFNNKYLSLQAIKTNFDYSVVAGILNNTFSLKSEIQDLHFKADYLYNYKNNACIRTGGEFILHQFNPNQTRVFGVFNDLLRQYSSSKFNSKEFAIFGLHDFSINARIKVNYGFRLSGSFGNSFSYNSAEPRLNIQYKVSERKQFKFSYNRMMQYMHLVSGSSAVMPTDIWFPVSKLVKPQQSHQIGFTYEHCLGRKYDWVFTLEPYFKTMQNLVEYKEGTQILLNNNIEQDLIQGIGRAYGLEFMLQKKLGVLQGWLNYTLSYSERQFEELNHGKWFYARYDRRHDANLTLIYNIKKNLILSSVFSISSGMRVTPIIGRYAMPSGSFNEIISVPIYGNRNSLSLSPVHRLDISLNYISKPWKKAQAEWSIGAYNVYNRTQAFKLNMESKPDGSLTFKQIGLYGFIPSLSLNIKF